TIGVVAVILFVAASMEELGVGFFDQVVVVESSRQIRRVRYCDWDVDPEMRDGLEKQTGRAQFDCEEATQIAVDRFVASVMFTTRDALLRKHQETHRRQLVLYVEFTNGATECRVADIPPRARQATRAHPSPVTVANSSLGIDPVMESITLR